MIACLGHERASPRPGPRARSLLTLPAIQPTKVELIINLKTAKARLTLPLSLLGRTDG